MDSKSIYNPLPKDFGNQEQLDPMAYIWFQPIPKLTLICSDHYFYKIFSL